MSRYTTSGGCERTASAEGARRRVAVWVRVLAWLFLAASGVAAWGVMRDWLTTGNVQVGLPGGLTALLMTYIAVSFAWVAITGKAPRFFPSIVLRRPSRTDA